MKKPEVSVVCTAYNHGKYIAQALDSVLSQKINFEIEILIADDCSTDETSAIIQEYASKDQRITILHREKNLRMLANMKDAFAHCKGDKIAILECDDFWIDEYKLQKQYDALNSDTNALLCFTNIKLYNQNSEKIETTEKEYRDQLSDKVTIQDILQRNNIGNFSCCMYKREALDLIPESYYTYKHNADWLFHLHILDKTPYCIFIKDICSLYRIHNTSSFSSLDDEKKAVLLINICIYYNAIFNDKYRNFFIDNIMRNYTFTHYSIEKRKEVLDEVVLPSGNNLAEEDIDFYNELLLLNPCNDDRASILLFKVKKKFPKLYNIIVKSLECLHVKWVFAKAIRFVGNSNRKDKYSKFFKKFLVYVLPKKDAEGKIYLLEQLYAEQKQLNQSLQQQIHNLHETFSSLQQKSKTMVGGSRSKSVELLIFDDTFPSKRSPFRYTEYVHYLHFFDNITIACTGTCLAPLLEESLEDLHRNFTETQTAFADKVSIYNPQDVYSAKLIYVTFLGNAINHDKDIANNPYIINLYSGGSLRFDDEHTDAALHKYLSSPMLRKVIVTQQPVKDYLLEKGFCSEDKIEFIFGNVTPQDVLEKEIEHKRYFGKDKKTLDICFVAHRYMPKAEDKGYDIFIDVAKELCKKYDNIHFHIVGPFDGSVIDVSDIQDKFHFYGIQSTKWFAKFYEDKDIILSPNKPFVISPGAFDGFPTASVAEAGLHGVAMFATDPLAVNGNRFIDGDEIIIIKPELSDITNKIEEIIQAPFALSHIAKNGRKKIQELYSFENQVVARRNIITNELQKLKLEESYYAEYELKSLGLKKFGKNVLISRKCSIYGAENISIGNNVRIDDFCILSGNISIGSYVHISASSSLYGKYGIEIGDFCGISPKSTLYSASDDFSGEYMISPLVPSALTNVIGGKIILENFVQLGANTIVMPKVSCKEGSATGAFSLVIHDLESWSIYFGCPVHKHKERSKKILQLREQISD